jgi:DNA-binding GntR family transcriptional regulator
LTECFLGVLYTTNGDAVRLRLHAARVLGGTWQVSINDKLSPIAESFTLKDHVFGVLRSAILDMDIYRPETDLRLDERRMAERLGVSRTPIREALARLAHEGLVEIAPRKGVFVRRKTREEILEMVITWAALEGMAARLATEVATDAALLALKRFALKHSSDVDRADIEEYSDANITFHQTILELSGCSLLRTTADGLFTHMQAVRRRAMGESDRARKSVADHMEIIDALMARDADLSARRVRDHTMRLYDHISKTWTRLETLGPLKSAVG